MTTTFRGFVRTTPVPLQDAAPQGGRLRVRLHLEAEILEHTTTSGTTSTHLSPVDLGVDLYGPGDVTGLVKGAITATSPPDGAGDVDGEFCPFVEFRSADLPWRYSIDPDTPEAAKPWLALVAGIEHRELGLARDGTLWMRPGLTADLDPELAAAWTHVQGEGAEATSRLLCPRMVAAGGQCLAALVPLRTGKGTFSWKPGSTAHGIPVLHLFRFSTNAAGTFQDLVEALRPVGPPPALGRVDLLADLDAGATPGLRTTTYGALAPHAAPAHAPLPDPTMPTTIAARLEPPRSTLPALPDAGGPPLPAPILAAPRWSAPFRWDEQAPWVGEVDTDPRHRAAAGLGARAALEWTDTILRAAGTRLGETQLAAAMLRHLCGGVALARLTTGHLPSSAGGLLAFHGPGLATVPANTPAGEPATALTALCPSGRALPPALLSAAATHLLRPTGPLAKASGDPGGVSDPEQVLTEALHCPEEQLAPLPVTRPHDGLEARLLTGLLGEHDRLEECQEPGPEWLGEAAKAVLALFRPDDVPVGRVTHRIRGLHEGWDVPLEVRPDLDLPLWDWFRVHAPDWLLPGAGLIEHDGVVALRTDRAFLAAALLGASRQAVGELRWRGVPIAHGWMPMRTFWQHVASPGQPAPMVDLVQSSSWPAVSLAGLPGPLGAGQDLVIAVRSDLVRRYPDTLVYLAPSMRIAGRGEVPLLSEDEVIWPSWVGRITPDVWFFGFPPKDLARVFVVLEEPDRGPRFRPPNGATQEGYTISRVEYKPDGTRSAAAAPPHTGLRDGAEFAAASYDRPIRALLSGKDLVLP